MTNNQHNKNLVLDFGNTLKKIAVFQAGELIHLKTYAKNSDSIMIKHIAKYGFNSNAIISSVIGISETFKKYLNENFNYLDFNHNTPLPVKIKYATPSTLGKDRLAAAVGAYNIFPNQNVLYINAGTCITFDFLNKKAKYIGGSISPGIIMRFKALHTLTKNLPLLSGTNQLVELTGKTTEASIKSGVMNGIIAETDGIIQKYMTKYPDLKVIISGGDIHFFEKNLKSPIFAFPNLVLTGLNQILEYNVK